MKFKSEEQEVKQLDTPICFFDVEVFPNLFVAVYKEIGKKKITLINPTPLDIQNMLTYNLVGYNCRRYDNHIVYGFDNLANYGETYAVD